MHNARKACLLLWVVGLVLALPGLALAQEERAQLVGRAVLPAAFLTDGPRAGTALSESGAIINGIKVPFDSQPVGTISGILPGQYPGTWLVLSSGQFDTPQRSADYLLRFYVVELDMRRVGSGSGEFSLLDWLLLADPNGKITGPIVNAETPTRYLTGADFVPRAFQRAAGGSFWVAEERLPALLRFDGVGKLLEAPVMLDGGALQGMSILPDSSALILAQRSPDNRQQVTFRVFDLTTRTFEPLPAVYLLENAAHSIGNLSMLNADEALVIEQDDQQNDRARFKRVFRINLREESVSKLLIADLLDIADPNGISVDPVFRQPKDAYGLGEPFRFPFISLTAMYPTDEQTLIIANNNRLPFGLGRSRAEADATEYIAIRLAQPLPLDPAFMRSLR